MNKQAKILEHLNDVKMSNLSGKKKKTRILIVKISKILEKE